MGRRIYLLDGRRTTSDVVDGFLHTRRKEGLDFICMGCGKPVLKGQQYILINYYDSPDPIHPGCYHFPSVLGVRQYIKKHFGLDKGHVDCVKLNSYDDLVSLNETKLRINT